MGLRWKRVLVRGEAVFMLHRGMDERFVLSFGARERVFEEDTPSCGTYAPFSERHMPWCEENRDFSEELTLRN